MIACRHYPMKGAANFRDLGGYACEGGFTAWGVFFRSTSLHKAQPEDVRLLERLGVTGILDLRYPNEQKDMPDPPVKGALWKGVSLMGPVPVEEIRVNDTVEDTKTLIRMYRQIINRSQPQIRDAVRFVIHSEGPAVFHCAAGKDRTGILSMLLLGAVGVDGEDIIADYEMSHHYIRNFTTDISGSHGSNMRKLWQEITSKWGSAGAFLKHCGISQEELDLLKEKFVVPYDFNDGIG